jgi:hypothetical protein
MPVITVAVIRQVTARAIVLLCVSVNVDLQEKAPCGANVIWSMLPTVGNHGPWDALDPWTVLVW